MMLTPQGRGYLLLLMRMMLHLHLLLMLVMRMMLLIAIGMMTRGEAVIIRGRVPRLTTARRVALVIVVRGVGSDLRLGRDRRNGGRQYRGTRLAVRRCRMLLLPGLPATGHVRRCLDRN